MKFFRFLLFPFAILYDLITSIRNYFFEKGILKSTSFKTPVLIVGNLSVGGTGKTPQIEYLIRLLKDSYKVAVLSRGYKRKTVGYLKLNGSHTADDVGDEPLQFFKKFSTIDVAVDANRVHGIQQLLKDKNPPNVILLDDAFQHRKVKGSFYILLTKYNDLYINDFLLPTGNLRESSKGAKRATIIVVTKCPDNLSKREQDKISNQLQVTKNQQVFFTKIKYSSTLKAVNEEILVKNLKNYEVLLVTGIANPSSLTNYLKDLKIVFKHLKFADHHHFKINDLDTINAEFNSLTSSRKIILTTEKDYVRLADKLDNLYYLEIETAFLNDENSFDKLVKKNIFI